MMAFMQSHSPATMPLIGQLTLPLLLGNNPLVRMPEVSIIANRLIQEATAWDSSAGVTDLFLTVQPAGFNLPAGTQPFLSSVETAHLTQLLHELKETTALTIGLQIEPNDVATAVALWQLGLVQWVMLAPFHQSILHPHFGFLSPYPLETLMKQWAIPETLTDWLVVNCQHWSLEALVHHWQYLQAHAWVKALYLSHEQAEALQEKGLWQTENAKPCWLADASITWLDANMAWLVPSQATPNIALCLHQLTLRPVQSAEPWPYSTDTTDPKRIEAYHKQVLHLLEQQFPPTLVAEAAPVESPPVEVVKQSKCPFGFGRK